MIQDADDNGHAARQLGRKLGELEKRRAHARIRRRNFARNRTTQRIAVEYLIQHGRCCADHIRPLLPPEFMNENGDDRWIGAAFGGLSDDGVIVELPHGIRSSRPEAHGRKLTLWGLPENGREIALRWLANHPVPLPEPAAATPPTAPPAEFPPPDEDPRRPAVSTVAGRMGERAMREFVSALADDERRRHFPAVVDAVCRANPSANRKLVAADLDGADWSALTGAAMPPPVLLVPLAQIAAQSLAAAPAPSPAHVAPGPLWPASSSPPETKAPAALSRDGR